MQRIDLTPDGLAVYEIASRSKPSEIRRPTINIYDGTVDCCCEDFTMRKRPQAHRDGLPDDEYVTIGDVKYHCFHIERAIADCIDRNEIELYLPQGKNWKYFPKGSHMDSETPAAVETLPPAPVPAAERFGIVRNMLKNGELIEGEDYGTIPGAGKKPTLLKPGAQRLMSRFDLASEIKSVEKQFDNNVLTYEIVVIARNKISGASEGEGIGSCNSGERRYARNSINDVANTVLKMAKKRALVDACLDALGISSLFTQDLEDMDELPGDMQGNSQPAAANQNRQSGNSSTSPRGDGQLRRFQIPEGTQASKCKSCKATIYWIETRNGKKMPLNEDGTSHFDTCPNSDKHRQSDPPPKGVIRGTMAEIDAELTARKAAAQANEAPPEEEYDPKAARQCAAIQAMARELWTEQQGIADFMGELNAYCWKYFHKNLKDLDEPARIQVMNALKKAVAEGRTNDDEAAEELSELPVTA